MTDHKKAYDTQTYELGAQILAKLPKIAANLTEERKALLIKNPAFLENWLKLALAKDHTSKISTDDFSGLFVSPREQMLIVRERNYDRGWGFTEADFKQLGPPEGRGSWSDFVLDVSLDTIEQTFEEACYWLGQVYSDKFYRHHRINSSPKYMRLLSGITHKRGLRWRRIDLMANFDPRQGVRSSNFINPMWMPHSGVLWAATYSPDWVNAMDGKDVPYVLVPGYEVEPYQVMNCGPFCCRIILHKIGGGPTDTLRLEEGTNVYDTTGPGACVPQYNANQYIEECTRRFMDDTTYIIPEAR